MKLLQERSCFRIVYRTPFRGNIVCKEEVKRSNAVELFYDKRHRLLGAGKPLLRSISRWEKIDRKRYHAVNAQFGDSRMENSVFQQRDKTSLGVDNANALHVWQTFVQGTTLLARDDRTPSLSG